jgi:uncharacterized protein
LKFAANFSVKPAFASCASCNEENFPIPQKNSEGSKSNHVLVPLSRPSQTSLRLRDDQAGRKQDQPVHEVLELTDEHGLTLLPEPSFGDIFFDLEGDPFVGLSGREYLFGFVQEDQTDQRG